MKNHSNKNKRKSPKIRFRLFICVLIPALILIVILWILQTMFLGMFYGNVKADELKKTAHNVAANLDSSDISDRILFLSSNGDINIRVIETSKFDTLYSSGEAFDSVTYGWGVAGMYRLYARTLEDGGELVMYYSETEEMDNAWNYFSPEMPPMPESRADKSFGRYFENVPRINFFDNIRKHNELLYSRITELSDGTEIMVVADTRISPLNSTVTAIKYQLVACSIITIILSLVVSYFMARHVAEPIEKINKSAKALAKGDLGASFEGQGYREIEELSDTLNYASKELEKVDKLRRELMANVSHDMRTPLTMIAGYGEMMRDIPGENNAENVQVIIDETYRLSEFVNSVLDLSKLESGMDNVQKTTVNITQLLRQTAERYKNLLSETGLEVLLFAREDVYVLCDEKKITQALYNLADNAVNYAIEPKKIMLRQTIKGDDIVRIEVCDNGEGIEADELPDIWDRYYRSDKSHKRNIVGSGIGLSIVKEIFKIHAVKYGVASKKGEGSVFWFEMKIEKSK